MTNCTITVIVTTCVITGALLSNAAQSKERKTFAPDAEALRDTWRQIRPAGDHLQPLAIARAQANLARCEGQLPVQVYLRARVAFVDGQKVSAERQLIPLVRTTVAPESIVLLMECRGESAPQRVSYAEALAKIVPLSAWSSQMDARGTIFTADISPSRAIVPILDREKMIQIAERLEQAGLQDLAWRAYSEAIYSGYSPAWAGADSDATWFSAEAAKYWAKAAKCAFAASKEDVAWDYLMKAAVFGSDELYQQALATAKNWTDVESKPAPTQPVRVEVKRDAILKAVRLYAEINAQPRSLALIDANKDVFDGPEELRKEVEAQWLALVKDTSLAAKKVTLYGHEVYPTGNPLGVRIPWAITDEILPAVQKELEKASSRPSR